MALPRPLLAATLLIAVSCLSGCVRTAASIVTAPVRAVGKGVDWATTSQSESDRNRGRALRHREERYGKLERDYRRHRDQCDDGDRSACSRARDEYDEMQDLRASIPADRDWRD